MIVVVPDVRRDLRDSAGIPGALARDAREVLMIRVTSRTMIVAVAALLLVAVAVLAALEPRLGWAFFIGAVAGATLVIADREVE